MHAPTTKHLEVTYHIVQFSKKNLGKGFLYLTQNDHEVEAFTNVDWVGSMIHRQFTFGYYTFVGGNLFTWRNKKKQVVARSSIEAEFQSMVHEICEIMWI